MGRLLIDSYDFDFAERFLIPVSKYRENDLNFNSALLGFQYDVALGCGVGCRCRCTLLYYQFFDSIGRLLIDSHDFDFARPFFISIRIQREWPKL